MGCELRAAETFPRPSGTEAKVFVRVQLLVLREVAWRRCSHTVLLKTRFRSR